MMRQTLQEPGVRSRRIQMREKVGLGILCTYVLAILAIFALIFIPSPGSAQSDIRSSLKVEAGEGHGSGVHIGNGFVVTAGHVVLEEHPTAHPKLEAKIELKTKDGLRVDPMVLWFNQTYDVALPRTNSLDSYPSAELVCTAPKMGERIEMVGNPKALEFIHTWGFVGGPASEPEPWKDLVVIRGPIDPRMSGRVAF